MSRFNIVIVDRIHPSFLDHVDDLPVDVLDAQHLSKTDLMPAMRSADVLVVQSRLRFDAALLDQLPKLRCIARVGAGLEHVDQRACADRGVAVLSSPEANRAAVAEHTIGMMLSLTKRLTAADRSMQNRAWTRDRFRGVELGSLTVGLVGYGHMGRAVARLLGPFGCRVLAHDTAPDVRSDEHADLVPFDELARLCNVLSLHIPATPQNVGLVNKEYLTRFENRPIVINTARGCVLSIRDATELLVGGSLSGLGLDVFEYEDQSFERVDPTSWPGEFEVLLGRDDVVLSPHVAGWSTESGLRHASVLAQKIRVALS